MKLVLDNGTEIPIILTDDGPVISFPSDVYEDIKSTLQEEIDKSIIKKMIKAVQQSAELPDVDIKEIAEIEKLFEKEILDSIHKKENHEDSI